METANFLASTWGLFFVIVPLSLLVNPRQLKEIFLAAERDLTLYIRGVLAFILGSATVLLNNVWEKDWKLLITIIGWVAIVKGLASMYYPEGAKRMIARMKDKEWVSYLLLAGVFLGLVLVYFGFTGK